MVDTSSNESRTVPPRVTGKSSKNSNGKMTGEKRKRLSFTSTQTVFLEQSLGKGNLDTKEGRQSVTYFHKGDWGDI